MCAGEDTGDGGDTTVDNGARLASLETLDLMRIEPGPVLSALYCV